jgi:hypothetical protein
MLSECDHFVIVGDKAGLMVEKKAWPPLYSPPRPGSTPAANGVHKVSTSELALLV